MNWDALGAVAETISAIGVLITLIYLAVQIKDNTRASRASAVNASNLALRENRQAIFASPEVFDLFYRGNANPLDLSDMELVRYRIMIQNVVESILDVYVQNFSTGYSPESWRTQGVTLVQRILGNRGGGWFWENYANAYPPDFRAEVNRILKKPASDC